MPEVVVLKLWCGCAQTSNPFDSDNYSVFVVNYYPKTAGTEWKPDTNRISPHTDETLVTLLFTSPGDSLHPVKPLAQSYGSALPFRPTRVSHSSLHTDKNPLSLL